VFPYLAAARENEPGSALYLPPHSGGRIDNPGTYSVLYLSDAAAGAIAEAFGRFPEWTPAILEGSPSLPGSSRAIARYRLADDARICNLDDAERLLTLGLRPSAIVSHDYTRSRGWARRIYEQGWSSFGLWDIKHLTLDLVSVLRLDQAAVLAASRTIVRHVVGPRGDVEA
jgi:hypothetical protein